MLFTFPSRYWFAIGLSGVFSLTGWAPQVHAGFLVPRATQDSTTPRRPFVYGAVTRYGRPFQAVPLGRCHTISWSYNPVTASTATVWATPLSLATTRGIICYFLLLWVLRCFSSPRSPPLQDDRPSACRVAPFGYPRIKGYLHLPTAFRSLSRPSSPPRAKASTVCPCLLSARRTSPCGLIYLKLALLVFLLVYLLLMSNMSKISL